MRVLADLEASPDDGLPRLVRVDVAELRAHLAGYLEIARSGGYVVVTDERPDHPGVYPVWLTADAPEAILDVWYRHRPEEGSCPA